MKYNLILQNRISQESYQVFLENLKNKTIHAEIFWEKVNSQIHGIYGLLH